MCVVWVTIQIVMCTNEKEHPFGCSLILLWVKIFKVYSFAGHLKTVCVDISNLPMLTSIFWANNARLSTQLKALCTPRPANRDYTAAAVFTRTCLLVRRNYVQRCTFIMDIFQRSQRQDFQGKSRVTLGRLCGKKGIWDGLMHSLSRERMGAQCEWMVYEKKSCKCSSYLPNMIAI